MYYTGEMAVGDVSANTYRNSSSLSNFFGFLGQHAKMYAPGNRPALEFFLD